MPTLPSSACIRSPRATPTSYASPRKSFRWRRRSPAARRLDCRFNFHVARAIVGLGLKASWRPGSRRSPKSRTKRFELNAGLGFCPKRTSGSGPSSKRRRATSPIHSPGSPCESGTHCIPPPTTPPRRRCSDGPVGRDAISLRGEPRGFRAQSLGGDRTCGYPAAMFSARTARQAHACRRGKQASHRRPGRFRCPDTRRECAGPRRLLVRGP